MQDYSVNTNAQANGDHEVDVVHLTEFAAGDDDRFLKGLTGMCTAENFPKDGESTDLEWEQGTQNFVISSVMMEGGAMP